MAINSVNATRSSNFVIGSEARVFAGHINDLNDFYLYTSWSYKKVFNLAPQFTEAFSKESTTSAQLNETFHVGDYCACTINDKDWDRGVIRQLDSNGFATIYRIDYGDVQRIRVQFLLRLQEWMFQTYRLAHHCTLSNIIKPINGWPSNVIDEFRAQLNRSNLYARFLNYNEIREISEVEIRVKGSTKTVNKDFERYQMERSVVQINDQHVYQNISMEILDCTRPNEICMLYYISPTRFYVYLKEKFDSHTSFQIDLQKSMQNLHTLSSPVKYQVIAVQDSRALWHRAVILDVRDNLSNICVYVFDIGHIECITINDIRQLPQEFLSKPAFAIPCRLYNVCPINGNEQSIWKLDDKVHDKFIRLMVNTVNCKVCSKQDKICYDVEIDIPKVGDLGAFLINNNLVSHATMGYSPRSNFSSGQPPQQSLVRPQFLSYGILPSRERQQQYRPTQQLEFYNNQNTMVQQLQTRTFNTGFQNTTAQQSSSTLSSIGSLLTIGTYDGYYIITKIRSVAEFYGLSQNRQHEFEVLSKELEQYYNNSVNNQSLTVPVILDGTPCVIEQHDKYYRVIIKHRENGSKVLVKLIDCGDEIVVDTSELLQIDKKFCTIPAFVQTFYLHGYDESQNSVNITRNLKKLLLNQWVHIAQQGLILNGRYGVHVTLCDNRSVNKMLLSN
ncbi:unnamed protein product [Rotaria sp. Silwood2]|nr:unnamed protein product [Rotaria sp. Silwood2]